MLSIMLESGLLWILFLLPGFYRYSPTSKSVKLQSLIFLSAVASYAIQPEIWRSTVSSMKKLATEKTREFLITLVLLGVSLKYTQRKLRYARINAIKLKYGYTDDPSTWEGMTVEQAQEIENNIGEWEFPRLWEFGWISDFIRTATDPGVSRALITGGHMINEDPYIEHERLQATIHAMRGLLSYKIGSPEHSLILSRINEHHHRYGVYINSDDVLYLITHFAFSPVEWVNKFGYRSLEAFEEHAAWVVWREIGVRMGCKYMPTTVQQAKEWRKQFEKICRWREDANEAVAMAMLNEIIYSVPAILKPFTRKFFASIVDWDMLYYCQLEKLGPSAILRSMAYDLFSCCAFLVREFGLPRLSAYKRTPDTPNKKGLVNFGHTPYDTLPFYQEQSFWNMFGYGAVLRRFRDVPLPSPKYQSDGTKLEALGAAQLTAEAQSATEKKVRENAAVMQKAGYGYRPAIGWMNGRFITPIDGPSYGSSLNTFPESTPFIPPCRRFENEFKRRGPGYSKVQVVESPEDVFAFDRDEYTGVRVNGFHEGPAGIEVSS